MKAIVYIVKWVIKFILFAPVMLVFENENPMINLIGLSYIAFLSFVHKRISRFRHDEH
jgi:hypothetical protein